MACADPTSGSMEIIAKAKWVSRSVVLAEQAITWKEVFWMRQLPRTTTEHLTTRQMTIRKTTTQTADTRRNDLNGRYTLGWDYDINAHNYMAASVRYGVRNGTNYQDDVKRVSPFGTQLWDSKSKDNSERLMSLDFTHTYENTAANWASRHNTVATTATTTSSTLTTASRLTFDSLVKNTNKV